MNWPLAISPFSVADRLKIGLWLLRNRQLTAGAEVRKYEERWEEYTGAAHGIMVSSGSTANELLASRRKHELRNEAMWPDRAKVIFPACTWVSSVSPWIREGFIPVWCDISTNLCASTDAIDRLLRSDQAIGTVFYTTLLGQSTHMRELVAICAQHGVRLMLDNCESSLSHASGGKHFCSLAPSSTSFYFSHPVTTGTEGGMVFCQTDEEADWFRMMRNHGLTRGMPPKYRNPGAHPSFDFFLPGTNYRSSDLQAYMGSLVMDRSIAFAEQRIDLADMFYDLLDKTDYVDITQGWCRQPLMALPIIPSPTSRIQKGRVSAVLSDLGIDHRPVVGGNMLRHTAFAKYGTAAQYPRAEWVHDNGCYVGLHEGVTRSMIIQLAKALNK